MLTLYQNYIYDNSYNNTKAHSTRQGQRSYFNNLIYKVIEDVNYIKDYESFVIEEEYETLLMQGINYISFTNEDKEIYAFITRKEYVTDYSTRIYYDIDVLQTFYFDIEISNPFLKRSNSFNTYDLNDGIETGEHIIESDVVLFEKEYNYYAMFNGIKEQQVILNDNGEVVNVVTLDTNTSSPTTVIDGIPYPLFFMPLKESYEEPTEVTEGVDSDGLGEVVASARKLIGLPYVWGGNYGALGDLYGNKANGTDCSGLCQWAYYDSGLMGNVNIPSSQRWTTYNMIEAGYSVDVSKAKPGDVIFSNFSSPGVPEHVVLIAKVNGLSITIIEAQQEGTNILERTITFDSNTMDIRRLI